jgi:hypothetical protein
MSESTRCIRQRAANESAIAALCQFAAGHSLDLTPTAAIERLGLDELHTTLEALLVYAKRLGFDVVPLEGDFDALPEVALPNIVALRTEASDEPAFAVLYEVDADGVRVADASTGETTRWSRDAFVSRWTGDCVSIDVAPARLASLRADLARENTLLARVRRALGLRPPYLPRAVFAATAAGLGIATAFASHERITRPVQGLLLTALAGALLSSLWAWLFAKGCPTCASAAFEAGDLPLTRVGVASYASSLAWAWFGLPSLLLAAALAVAGGAHLELFRRLRVLRLRCIPCIVTALSAWLALAMTFVAQTPLVIGGLVVVVLASALSARPGIDWAHARADAAREQRILGLAKRVTSEEPPQAGTARLVVYKTPTCSACMIFEAVVQAAIAERFGDRVQVVSREGTRERVPTPLALVRDSVSAVLVNPSFEDLEPLLEEALAGTEVASSLRIPRPLT